MRGTNFCDYSSDFCKKLSLEPIFPLRKRIEAWWLTGFASVVRSDGVGDPVGHGHQLTALPLRGKATHRFATTPCEDAPGTTLPSQDSNRPIRVLDAFSL